MTTNEAEGTNELYSVFQFFDNGTQEQVRQHVPADEAVKAADHYTKSVAARLGMTVRVIIVNMLDETVFEWTFKDGVVFPTLEQIKELAGE